MSGSTVIAPNANTKPSGLGRAREAIADVVIVTAVVWIPILLMGALAAAVRLIF